MTRWGGNVTVKRCCIENSIENCTESALVTSHMADADHEHNNYDLDFR